MSTDPRKFPELPDSLWVATAPSAPSCPPLSADRSADLCVVGGGFTGLSAAYHAAEAGAEVALVEAAEPGWGAAGRNGGQVIPGLKLDPDDLERRFGTERGRRLVDFAGAAPDLVFELVARHGIDCGARREGWIHAVHGRAALQLEEDRVRQWRARGGALEMLDRDQVAALLGTREYIAVCSIPAAAGCNHSPMHAASRELHKARERVCTERLPQPASIAVRTNGGLQPRREV